MRVLIRLTAPSFLIDDTTLVQGAAFRGDCEQLESWYNMPSNPPSIPRHQHRADEENIAFVRRTVFQCRWDPMQQSTWHPPSRHFCFVPPLQRQHLPE